MIKSGIKGQPCDIFAKARRLNNEWVDSLQPDWKYLCGDQSFQKHILKPSELSYGEHLKLASEDATAILKYSDILSHAKHEEVKNPATRRAHSLMLVGTSGSSDDWEPMTAARLVSSALGSADEADEEGLMARLGGFIGMFGMSGTTRRRAPVEGVAAGSGTAGSVEVKDPIPAGGAAPKEHKGRKAAKAAAAAAAAMIATAGSVVASGTVGRVARSAVEAMRPLPEDDSDVSEDGSTDDEKPEGKLGLLASASKYVAGKAAGLFIGTTAQKEITKLLEKGSTEEQAAAEVVARKAVSAGFSPVKSPAKDIAKKVSDDVKSRVEAGEEFAEAMGKAAQAHLKIGGDRLQQVVAAAQEARKVRGFTPHPVKLDRRKPSVVEGSGAAAAAAIEAAATEGTAAATEGTAAAGAPATAPAGAPAPAPAPSLKEDKILVFTKESFIWGAGFAEKRVKLMGDTPDNKTWKAATAAAYDGWHPHEREFVQKAIVESKGIINAHKVSGGRIQYGIIQHNKQYAQPDNAHPKTIKILKQYIDKGIVPKELLDYPELSSIKAALAKA